MILKGLQQKKNKEPIFEEYFVYEYGTYSSAHNTKSIQKRKVSVVVVRCRNYYFSQRKTTSRLSPRKDKRNKQQENSKKQIIFYRDLFFGAAVCSPSQQKYKIKLLCDQPQLVRSPKNRTVYATVRVVFARRKTEPFMQLLPG